MVIHDLNFGKDERELALTDVSDEKNVSNCSY